MKAFSPIYRLWIPAVFLCTVPALAQDMYQPDRPGNTIPATTMPEGQVSLEAGFTWTHVEFSPQLPLSFNRTWTIYEHDRFDLPAGLLRVGISEGFELRLSSGYVRRSWEYDPNFFDGNGVDDPVQSNVNAGLRYLNVGVKSALRAEQDPFPALALIAGLSMPQTGTSVFQVNTLAPDLALAFSHTLSEEVSLGYHAGVRWDGSVVTATSFYAANITVEMHHDVAAFIELHGELPGYAPAMHVAAAGLAWMPLPDLVIDASAGLALNAPGETEANPRWTTVQAPDLTAGIGAAWRLHIW